MQMLMQFWRFAAVGLSGFVLDTAVVYALRAMLGPYFAGIFAYFVAATNNWIWNRIWTFSAAASAPALRQWMTYIVANTIGFVCNRGVYALCIWRFKFPYDQPVIALAAGTAAGTIINFFLTRKVFTSAALPPPASARKAKR